MNRVVDDQISLDTISRGPARGYYAEGADQAHRLAWVFHVIPGTLHLLLYSVAVAYRGGLGVFNPPRILKALQNRARLNPIVKTVKNC